MQVYRIPYGCISSIAGPSSGSLAKMQCPACNRFTSKRNMANFPKKYVPVFPNPLPKVKTRGGVLSGIIGEAPVQTGGTRETQVRRGVLALQLDRSPLPSAPPGESPRPTTVTRTRFLKPRPQPEDAPKPRTIPASSSERTQYQPINSTSKSTPTAPRPEMRTLTPRDITKNMSTVDFSTMPPKTKSSRKARVGFASIDLSVLLPALSSRSLPTYNSPGFTLRACPSSTLPAAPAPPFPPHMILPRKEERTIHIGLVTSRAKLSKLAVERNTARRRLKSAFELVVNRGVGIGGDVDGMEYILDGYTYLAQLRGDILNIPYGEVVTHVALGLVKIRRDIDSGFQFRRR